MLALTGTMYATPAAPSGIKSVSAASGPYAAELSASRPKIGIPATGADLFRALIGSRQRLSEKYVHKRHGPSQTMDDECNGRRLQLEWTSRGRQFPLFDSRARAYNTCFPFILWRIPCL